MADGQTVQWKFDTRNLDAAMDSLYNAMILKGKDASNLIEDEHRFLVKTIVNFTPPTASVWGPPKLSGEQALRFDVEGLIKEAAPKLIDTIGSKYGLTNIDTYITSKGGEKVQVLWKNLDPEGSQLRTLHEKYQNKQGKTLKGPRSGKGQWRAQVMTSYGNREPYIIKRQKRVGRWRAKWAVSAARKGATFPNWVSRHFGALGNSAPFQFHLEGEKPYVEFGVVGRDVARNHKLIQEAIKIRARAIRDKIVLILNDYNADLAKGIRAQTKAGKYKNREVRVE